MSKWIALSLLFAPYATCLSSEAVQASPAVRGEAVGLEFNDSEKRPPYSFYAPYSFSYYYPELFDDSDTGQVDTDGERPSGQKPSGSYHSKQRKGKR